MIGWSAAAFVFGPTLELVNEYSPEMNTVGLDDLPARNLSSVEILPHYSRCVGRFERLEERCRAYESRKHTEVIRHNDGDAVIVQRNAVRLIRA